MKNRMIVVLFLLSLVASALGGQVQEGKQLEWSRQLFSGAEPASFDKRTNFVGIHNGALIIAGDIKTDTAEAGGRVTILVADEEGKWKKQIETVRTDGPLLFDTVINTPDGLVCLGNTDGRKLSDEVFRLSWDCDTGRVRMEALERLKFPLSYSRGCFVNETIYLIGQKDIDQTGPCFLALDTSDPEVGWQELEPLPGQVRTQSLVVAQNDGADDCIFVFGGKDTDGKPLNDAYKYNPRQSTWKRLADLSYQKNNFPDVAACGAVVPFGDSHLFVFENIRHDDSAGRVWTYHTITDTWVKVGDIPADLRSLGAVRSDGQILMLGQANNSNLLSVHSIKINQKLSSFGLLNLIALVAYMLTLVGMGFFFSRREKNSEDFFVGGRRIPWWAAGMSIFGTQLSSIAFMAIPAKVYMTDWLYYTTLFCIVGVQPIVVYFYLPFFRRLNVTSAYEYLELRFNLIARLFGSLSFILYHCSRVLIVLFLPSLALSAVTGININICILVMGFLATLYTVLGGIEAVIWTDVLQVIVLVGAGLVSLGVIVTKCGGFGEVFALGQSADKFRMVNMGWDWTAPVLWVVVIGNLFSNMMSYSADQAVIQRYLTTPDEKSAAKAIWTNAAVTIPVSTIWFLLGTALFAFYKLNPASLDPTLKNDQIFPLFIAQQLPDGLVGVIIAGLFAAAMSTVDSSINSISTVITTDFYKRFNPAVSDHRCLVSARILTVFFGLFITAMALWMAANQDMIKSLWDTATAILGLVMGGITGLFALGIFTRRANGLGALVGIVVSVIVLWQVQTRTEAHFFLYAVVGISSCYIAGYLASLVLPTDKKSIQGLTVYTMRKRSNGVIGNKRSN